MYISKHFTCEEIDQRLLQGYYDDAVSNGFVGTLKEFWDFIIGLKDNPNTEQVNQLITNLEEKLKDIIEQAVLILGETDDALDEKIDFTKRELEEKLEAQKVTKVSQLDNDLKFQTQEQVEKYISDLVNGADQALDTLLELANALGNDPHFAATITEKLGQLKDALDAEIARAKEIEAELKQAIQTEIEKREAGDANTLQIMEEHVSRLSQAIQDSFGQVDAKVTTLQTSFQNLQTEFNNLTKDVNDKISASEQRMSDKIDELKDDLEEGVENKIKDLQDKISQEVTNRQEGDSTLQEKIADLTSAQIQQKSDLLDEISEVKDSLQAEVEARTKGDGDLQTQISNEITARTNADAALQEKISQEVLDRIQGDANLQEKISSEKTERIEKVGELTAKLNDETTARQVKDTELEGKIDKHQVESENAIKTLQQGLSEEISRAKAVEEDKVNKREGYDLSKNNFTDALKEKLENIQAQANYITRVSELINDAGYVNEAAVNAAIQQVIGAAPDVLNTLEEIAKALGDDPDFINTMLTRISTLAGQLNEETEARIKGDADTVKELTNEINKAVQELNSSYALLEERLTTYKTLCDNNNTVTNGRIDSLDEKVGETKEYFVEKVKDLSDTYTEKVNNLQTQVNEYTSQTNTRLGNQDSLIKENTAAIQRNLELIQGLTTRVSELSESFNTNLNQALAAVQAEADARRSADEALGNRITQVESGVNDLGSKLNDTQAKVNQNTAAIEDIRKEIELDTLIIGSDSIKITSEPASDEDPSFVERKRISVIVNPDDSHLSVTPKGLTSSIDFNKAVEESTETYTLTGNNSREVPGAQVITVPIVEKFVESDAQDLYNEIYNK